jgi:hypothetical protein
VQCTQIEACQQITKLEYIPDAEACGNRRENHNLPPPEPYNNGIGKPLVLPAHLSFRHINTGKRSRSTRVWRAKDDFSERDERKFCCCGRMPSGCALDQDQVYLLSIGAMSVRSPVPRGTRRTGCRFTVWAGTDMMSRKPSVQSFCAYICSHIDRSNSIVFHLPTLFNCGAGQIKGSCL